MTRTARPVTYRTTAVRTPDSVTLSVRRSPRELLHAVVARLLGRTLNQVDPRLTRSPCRWRCC